MDIEVLGRALTTLPENDDHPLPHRPVAAPSTPSGAPTISRSSANFPTTSTASTCATPKTLRIPPSKVSTIRSTATA